MGLVSHGVRHKEKISETTVNKPSYPLEFHANVFRSTFIETITYILMFYLFFKHKNTYDQIKIKDVVYFIPTSFLFEFIFDFFHYWSHRILHHKYFYKYAHKKHHKYLHPTTIITYFQDPLDLILTNTLPILFTLSLLPWISYKQFNFLLVYKEYIEICGHSGRYVYPTGSFGQFKWLPECLGIQLHTEDHDLHHTSSQCNYGKRFCLWDKVFGTYASGHEKHVKYEKKNKLILKNI
jgi:sterol desaturase/sphingolipid hydroxylase (fatty acid hydroxylase superfamily)